MTAALRKSDPVLRAAAGEPPLGRDGKFFRDDQGEIFEHDNERYRSASTKIGILELENGKWLAQPPSFHVDGQQYDSRDHALRAGIARLIRRSRKYEKNGEGDGTHWSEGYAGRVREWALSIKPEVAETGDVLANPDSGITKVALQGTTDDASQPNGHPGTDGSPSGASARMIEAPSDGDNSPQTISSDPIVAMLVEAHRARKLYPAGHTFSMTNPIVNGQMVTMGTCSCGETFSYKWGSYERMDAAIEAHWQKFDHLPEKVDGRGNPINAEEGSAASTKPTRRAKQRSAPKTGDNHEPANAALPEPASVTSNVVDAGSPLSEAGGNSQPRNPAPVEVPSAGAGEIVAAQICAPDTLDWDSPLIKMAIDLAWREEDAYEGFLTNKVRDVAPCGFDVEADALNPALKPFQRDIVRWALRQGRAALFAGTGLGKTLQQLVWADEVSRRHGSVLILTPLAVAQQTVAEAIKFGIDGVAYARSAAEISSRIVVANYERLDKFDPSQFAGVVLDESSILKSFDGKTRTALTEAFAATEFRLCCTATPAPNDYTELGTHAEFLGVLLHKEMLATWFVHDGSSRATNVENYGQRQGSDWRLKGHAHEAFWRWLATWSVMIRHPRDLGYEDIGYDLPALLRHQLLITTKNPEGLLGPKLAHTLSERLTARRETIAAAAEIVNAAPDRQWLVWCNLNDESAALAKAIPGAVEVRGSDDPDLKAERLLGFAAGNVRVLVSKPSIAGWGMNFQRCADMVFVGLNDSFEQLYQAIRRCWRFGQIREVNVHLIAADVEGEVVANLEAKEVQADYMAEAMVGHMRGLTVKSLRSLRTISVHDTPMQLPEWLKCA